MLQNCKIILHGPDLTFYKCDTGIFPTNILPGDNCLPYSPIPQAQYFQAQSQPQLNFSLANSPLLPNPRPLDQNDSDIAIGWYSLHY